MKALAGEKQAVVTLTFAEAMVTTVRKRRAEQLAAGRITQEKHDADVLAAAELLRLAQDVVIFGGPPLN